MHRNKKIRVLGLALFALLLALLALACGNPFGNYTCSENPAACQSAAMPHPNPPCCMDSQKPFVCTEMVDLGTMGECPAKFGICALNDGDAISQMEIRAQNNNLTLTSVVCAPSYCDPRGQPANRAQPRHPLDTDAGPIEVEDLDGGALSCDALMADAGVCTALADACTADGDCCSGICSESDACEACRADLEGCTNDSDCCSGICSLNACGGNAPGAGGSGSG